MAPSSGAVDAAINAGIMERTVAIMPDDLPVLVLPPQHVGKSVEHLRFPGTLTLSYETIAKVWYEIGESVHRAGIRKLVLANSHGGQISIMEIVARELRIKLGMFVVCLPVTAGRTSPRCLRRRKCGTASMPENMRPLPFSRCTRSSATGARAQRRQCLARDRGRRWAHPADPWAADAGLDGAGPPPFGVAGNAAAADAERGAAALDLAAQNLLSALREVVDYPLERLRETTIYDQAE